MTDAAAQDPPSRTGLASCAALALLGGLAVWMLARPAPADAGAARLRSPEILLAAFDSAWLLLLALPRDPSWPGTAARVAVGVPFHCVIGAASGAGPGFHAAWGLTAGAFAAVGAMTARAAPRTHGAGLALLCVALPLAAYAAGDLGGAEVRSFLLASPAIAPTVFARTCTTVVPADAVPALIAASLLFAVELAAARRHRPVAS